MRSGLLVPVLGLAAATATAGERFRVEIGVGAASSFGSTLRVEQSGFPELVVDADWETRAFESPLYYTWRLALADDSGAWALRFVHHKVYLENPPPEIAALAVSHGYNLLTLERAFRWRGFELSAGLGAVIAHPESTVRGQTRDESSGGPFGGGYFFTGPTVAAAASRRLEMGSRFALVPELRFTYSRARVPIAGGEASVPNTAVHLALGLEARF